MPPHSPSPTNSSSHRLLATAAEDHLLPPDHTIRATSGLSFNWALLLTFSSPSHTLGMSLGAHLCYHSAFYRERELHGPCVCLVCWGSQSEMPQQPMDPILGGVWDVLPLTASWKSWLKPMMMCHANCRSTARNAWLLSGMPGLWCRAIITSIC